MPAGQRSWRKNVPPLLIITAMDMEADILIGKLENKHVENIYKYTFYEWRISGYPVVICLSRVNTRNASVATYIAIEKYHPIAIINPWTAWGHGKIVHPGDVIIVEDCFNIISWRAQIKAEWEWSNSLERNLLTFSGDSWSAFQLLSGDNNLIKIAKKIKNPHWKVYVGRIASWDFRNREADKILFLNKEYDTLWEDMECVAIYDIAHDFNIPALWIKAISNNEILGEKFDKNMSKVPQEFAYELILQIIKNIKNLAKK